MFHPGTLSGMASGRKTRGVATMTINFHQFNRSRVSGCDRQQVTPLPQPPGHIRIIR